MSKWKDSWFMIWLVLSCVTGFAIWLLLCFAHYEFLTFGEMNKAERFFIAMPGLFWAIPTIKLWADEQ